jgi:hypothetical protein
MLTGSAIHVRHTNRERERESSHGKQTRIERIISKARTARNIAQWG